jgi:hypothetical protein
MAWEGHGCGEPFVRCSGDRSSRAPQHRHIIKYVKSLQQPWQPRDPVTQLYGARAIGHSQQSSAVMTCGYQTACPSHHRGE